MADRIAIAILAKAPAPGLVKTRLIPVLGADGAAALQARLIERAVVTASSAALGQVMPVNSAGCGWRKPIST